ncbi:hypothetical protein [Actinacidiphila acididurans]|uniref:Uncharacterized protein n=1 Tax=Actinacidiphila acididurans TaxID=2784346 RepID=A0ABS2U437_9ACTN|nr:hypothetical protein [Actinacidiphila acididurans]MBM9510377.1 hypothetical protein [Actinacidiphila acididurans]
MHSGAGDQYVTFYVQSIGDGTRRRDRRAVAEDQLQWLRRRFVHPMGFARARQLLAAHNTVLLTGSVGSGRTSAGRMLLHELPRDAGTVHDLLVDDRQGHSRLDPEQVGTGDRLLLDVSKLGDPLWTEVHDELPGLRKTVQDRHAHLVVVLPQVGLRGLGQDLGAYRAEIGDPDRMRVLQRCLRLAGLHPSETLEPSSDLIGFLDHRPPMGEVARLADLMARARDRGNGAFAQWAKEALNALRDRSSDVTKLVASLRESPQRALLITVAMLHEARSDAMYEAGRDLLRTVGYRESDRPLLERADLAERYEQIKAGADSLGRVTFEELGYDEAVRSHFWRYAPDLRDRLSTWVGSTVALDKLSDDDRQRLVARFAEQRLSGDSAEGLIRAAVRWTESPQHRSRSAAAVQAFGVALDDDRHGAEVRYRLRQMAAENALTDGLVPVLVTVCENLLAVRHPDQAMVRLHHLARRERDGTLAHDALLRLVRDDPRLLRRLLNRLARVFGSGPRPADFAVFLALAEPGLLTASGAGGWPLLAEAGARRDLVTGWNAVLGSRPRETWRGLAHRWFDATRTQSELADAFLDVLVAAGQGSGLLLGRLYVTVGEWAAQRRDEQSPAAPVVADHLYSKINEAQGIRGE